MGPAQIKYYRFECSSGLSYYAARSKNAVLRRLGSPRDVSSCAAMFGYILNTLEQVAEEEARKTPYFKHFAINRRLCDDGIWDLGRLPSINQH